jgi:hypothetical protein
LSDSLDASGSVDEEGEPPVAEESGDRGESRALGEEFKPGISPPADADDEEGRSSRPGTVVGEGKFKVSLVCCRTSVRK